MLCVPWAFCHIALAFLIVFIQSKVIFFPTASYPHTPELPPKRQHVLQAPERAKLQYHTPLVLGSEWNENHLSDLPSSAPDGLAKINSEGSGKRWEFKLWFGSLWVVWKEGTGALSWAERKSMSCYLCTMLHCSFFLCCHTIEIMIFVLDPVLRQDD